MAQAAAAALLLAGGAWSAFGFTENLFDEQDALQKEWRDAQDLQIFIGDSAIQVDSVVAGPPVVVTLTNTGTTTLDASAVTVLLDGVAATVDSWTVEGVSSNVWTPGATLALTMDLAASVTDRAAVATEHGVMAFGGL